MWHRGITHEQEHQIENGWLWEDDDNGVQVWDYFLFYRPLDPERFEVLAVRSTHQVACMWAHMTSDPPTLPMRGYSPGLTGRQAQTGLLPRPSCAGTLPVPARPLTVHSWGCLAILVRRGPFIDRADVGSWRAGRLGRRRLAQRVALR